MPLLSLGAIALAAACGPSVMSDPGRDAPTADALVTVADAPAPRVVFPVDPILDPGVPAGAPGAFGNPSTGGAGGPCLTEPVAGSLLPAHFLRLRFVMTPTAGENLFEVRLHVASIDHDLVAYTQSTTWTIPAAIWAAMNDTLVDQPISFSVRSGRWNGSALVGAPLIGSYGNFRIAPAVASGTIVYWTNGGNNSVTAFKGFRMGDETVAPVLGPSNVGGDVVCVGCHSSTPDGKYVAFSAATDRVRGDYTHVEVRSVDGLATQPPFLTPSALTLLARNPNQEAPLFSPGHWADGDHKMLSMFPVANRPEIVWTDLEAASTVQNEGWGVVTRDGDIGQAGAAAWSHDGKTIAYSSGPLVTSGMNLDDAHGDIYTVPFNGGVGGTATPLPGASDPAYTEHYAAFSADDKLIAFVRVGGTDNPYNNPLSEVFVVPATGGTPKRLAANDPLGCSAAASPGVHNTWPKWSPATATVDGVTYYWLTFSSTRAAAGVPQLYVAPITVDATGSIATYPALYLWNQPPGEHNHTPAWDAFDIPPVN
ncbi:MAG: hypothetical protein K8W52_25610 [Deltaproteobacteria bacterium]|nr:hypothetical protein [Deltaproteobacteria bacterium]